jgi:hypothetical protein
MHVNYNIFLQYYEEKVQVSLLVMKEQTLLQPKDRFNMHLFQDSMMCTTKNKS